MIRNDSFFENLIDTLKEEISWCDAYKSREALAERLGMSRETLCRKVNDPDKIRLSELARIAQALGRKLHISFE